MITVTPQEGKVFFYVTEAWVWITCAGWQVTGKGQTAGGGSPSRAAVQRLSSVLPVGSNLLERCEEMMLLWRFHKAKKAISLSVQVIWSASWKKAQGLCKCSHSLGFRHVNRPLWGRSRGPLRQNQEAVSGAWKGWFSDKNNKITSWQRR